MCKKGLNKHTLERVLHKESYEQLKHTPYQISIMAFEAITIIYNLKIVFYPCKNNFSLLKG